MIGRICWICRRGWSWCIDRIGVVGRVALPPAVGDDRAGRYRSWMSGALRHAAVVTWHIDTLVNDALAGVWGREHSLTLHKLAGESRDHVVLKLCGALCLAHRTGSGDRLRVEAPLRVVGYKPDVVVTDPSERPIAWVECGDVSVHKLDRLTRALGGDVVVQVMKNGLKPARELARALTAIARPERVVVIGFVPDGISALGEALEPRSRSSVVATISSAREDDDTLELAIAVDDNDVLVRGRRCVVAP